MKGIVNWILAAGVALVCAACTPPPEKRTAPVADGPQEILPGELNVRDFGAVGDGVHDDADAIERAIKAAQAHDLAVRSPAGTMGENDGPHQAVVFPGGTYRLARTVFTGRDVHLRGFDGATIVQTRAYCDAFYFHKGARVRVEGLRFKGGRHALNLATLNHENANFLVRKCVFAHTTAAAVHSISRSAEYFRPQGPPQRVPIAEYQADAKGDFFPDSRFADGKGYNNSTFYLIEDSFFDHCVRAINIHTDGGVVRNCRIVHPPVPGGPIVGPEISVSASLETHYYNLDVLVERTGRPDQAFFDLQFGTHVIAIEDSTFRTSDGSGIPLLDSRSASPYFFSSYFVRNVSVACGGEKEAAVIRLHPGAAPQILCFDGVRDVTGKPVRALAGTEAVDEAWLHRALNRFDSPHVPLEQRYTFTFDGCSANMSTDLGPVLNRFVKPFPKDLPKPVLPRPARRELPRRVVKAVDFGVCAGAANGKDDTAALQRFVDALAAADDAVGVLPPEWMHLTAPVTLHGRITLLGAGTTAFRTQGDGGVFFKIANGADVTLRNLVFQNGRHVLEYAAEEAWPTRVTVDNCFAFNTHRRDRFKGAMFDFKAQRHAERVEFYITGGSYYASVFYRGNVRAFFDGFWFRALPRTAEAANTWSTAILNERGGQMRVADLLGVPIALIHKGAGARNDPTQKVGDFRWFDNWGELQVEHMRFGGELGGLVPVYAHGAAKTYICGQFGEFKTFCCRQTPVFSDSDEAQSCLFSTFNLSRPLLPEQAKRIRFENYLWLRQ